MCNIAGAMFPGLIEDLDDDTIDRGIDLNLKGVLYGTQLRDPGDEALRTRFDRERVVGCDRRAVRGDRRVRVHQGRGRDAHDDRGARGRRARHPRQRDRTGRHAHAVHHVATPQPDGTLDQEAYDAFVEQSKQQSPLHTLGEPIDQALLIHYLVSDAARFATGNIFRVNGGQTMAW